MNENEVFENLPEPTMKEKIIGWIVLYGVVIIPWFIGCLHWGEILGEALWVIIVWMIDRVKDIQLAIDKMHRRNAWLDKQAARDEANEANVR